MTHAHGGLLVVMVALGMGVLLGNVLVALGVGLFPRARLARLAPVEVARLALFGLMMPLLVGVASVFAVLVEPLLALLHPSLDHCVALLGAPHVCFVHGTFYFSSLWEAAGVALFTLAVATAVGAEAYRLVAGRRALHALVQNNPVRDDGDDRVTWTVDETPYAFTVGLLKPRVIISMGIRHILSAPQIEAALEHERAHVRHRDALVRCLARLGSFLLLRPLRAKLSDLLVLGQELRADHDAASVVKSEALVAQTLLAMVNAPSRQNPRQNPLAMAPALVGSSLEARVQALCGEPRRGRVAPALLTGLALIGLSFTAAQSDWHHGAESVAGVLLSTPVHAHDERVGSDFHFITQ